MSFYDRPLPEFQVDGASPTFDLTLISFGRAVLAVTGLSAGDSNLSQQLMDNMDQAASRILATLEDYNAGILLRINLQKTGGGSVGIPGGELMTLIGLGKQPTDALAEYYRGPGKNSPAAAPRNDASSFFWFTLPEASNARYEMTDALAQEIGNVGFDPQEIEYVIRQLDAYASTGDETLVSLLLTHPVSVGDGDQPLEVSGEAALRRLADVLSLFSADLKDESKIIVGSDGIALAFGGIWLGAAPDSDRIVIVAING